MILIRVLHLSLPLLCLGWPQPIAVLVKVIFHFGIVPRTNAEAADR